MQPLKIAIMAMGGEGGGVLADWIVDLGEASGYLAQTTSVPGVAQRTGATIYYVELYPAAQAEADGAQPVLALMPLPGDVDVVLASELMEAGRAMQRGLVTPDRTTLVASTHRVYSIAEKSALGDGRVYSDALLAHAATAARRFVRFDMAAAAEQNGSVISAVLFGALAGTGVLPFSRAQFEATISRGGVGVASSLKAFAAAFAQVQGGSVDAPAPAAMPLHGDVVAQPAAAALDGTTDAPPAPRRLARGRPSTERRAGAPPVRSTRGVRALLDRIAASSRRGRADAEGRRASPDRLPGPGLCGPLPRSPEEIAALSAGDARLLDETARHLALWMSYEDTARVAALKTRGTRFERVRGEVRAGRDQVLAIDEYLHPGVREIAETLPAAIGRGLERPGLAAALGRAPHQEGPRSSPPARSAAS